MAYFQYIVHPASDSIKRSILRFIYTSRDKQAITERMRYPFQSSDKITKAMDSHIFPSRMKRYQIAGTARMGKKDII